MSDTDGLGVIWNCDNCNAQAETNLVDVPAGWLNEEVDEDDYPEGEEVPWELILCDRCRAPEYVDSDFGHPTPEATR